MNTKRFPLLLLAILLNACTTYTIQVESLRQQLSTVDTKTLQTVKANNPLSGYNNLLLKDFSYEANGLKWIYAVDKNGNKETILNSPSIGMRITTLNGKRRVVYFDTVIVKNDTLYGSGSRLLAGINRKIALDQIVKIEVQDGGKNYYYK